MHHQLAFGPRPRTHDSDKYFSSSFALICFGLVLSLCTQTMFAFAERIFARVSSV